MKEIHVKKIEDKICQMVQEINFNYPPDVLKKLEEGYKKESSKIGKETLQLLMESARNNKKSRKTRRCIGLVDNFLKSPLE